MTMRCTLALVALLASVPALADTLPTLQVGELARDRFPFVVKINATWPNNETSWCSAALLANGLVATAAHCVFNEKTKLASAISIDYTDSNGKKRSIPTATWVYPAGYPDFHKLQYADIEWHRKIEKMPNDKWPKDTAAQVDARLKNYANASLFDIA
jgi:V8-like Glu-specific endopeptidase